MQSATPSVYWPVCVFRDIDSIQMGFIGMRKQTFTFYWPTGRPTVKCASEFHKFALKIALAFFTDHLESEEESTFLCPWSACSSSETLQHLSKTFEYQNNII